MQRGFRWMDKQEFIAHLQKQIDRAGSQEKLAKSIGVSDTYVSSVRRGKCEPSAKFCESLGFRKVVTFEEIEDGKV